MKRGYFTHADDRVLMAAKENGIGWDQIQANYFPRRTVDALRNRYRRLTLGVERIDHVTREIRQEETSRKRHSDALWQATNAYYQREAAKRGLSVMDTALTILHGADVVARVRSVA